MGTVSIDVLPWVSVVATGARDINTVILIISIVIAVVGASQVGSWLAMGGTLFKLPDMRGGIVSSSSSMSPKELPNKLFVNESSSFGSCNLFWFVIGRAFDVVGCGRERETEG